MSILSQAVDSNLETSAAGRFLSKFGRELVTGVALTAATLGIGATTAQAQQAQNVASATANTSSPAYQQAYAAGSEQFTPPARNLKATPQQVGKLLGQANSTLEALKQAYPQLTDSQKGTVDGMLAGAGKVVKDSAGAILGNHGATWQPIDPKLSLIDKMQAQIDQAGPLAVPPAEYAEAKQTAATESSGSKITKQECSLIGGAGGMIVAKAAGFGGIGTLATMAAGAVAGGAACSDKAKTHIIKAPQQATTEASQMASAVGFSDAQQAWFVMSAVSQVANAVSLPSSDPQLRQHSAPANSNSASNNGGSATTTLASTAGGRGGSPAAGNLPD